MSVNQIDGTPGADSLLGTAGDDLLLGAGPTPDRIVRPLFTLVGEGLGQTLFATAAPGDSGRLVVLDKTGLARILDVDTGGSLPFLDLRAEINASGEQGLLGLAFHPDFATNGRFYVYLSNLGGDTEIREYRVDPADPDVVLAGSGRILLTVPQPSTTNHKGGWIGFGGDGLLYIALGDGGGTGDPLGTGQDNTDLLGSILRIDVDRDDFAADPTREYGIPTDNPFAGTVPGADEVWAYGLRNPFRDSFDRGTDVLWIADVGQSQREEIDLGEAGGNYGWSLFEGDLTYPDGVPATPPAGILPPIFDYDRTAGDRSVTGGYVYRGPETGLQGLYVFGDFASGRIWALRDRDGDGVFEDNERKVLDDGGLLGPGQLTSFGEDAEGNLYAVAIDGRVYRLDVRAPDGSFDAGDTISGGRGNDRAFGGLGDDTIKGGDGDDLLQGMEGQDRLRGGDGADSLVGGDGIDTLLGEAGDDTLLGGLLADRLDGGAGNDVLVGGGGGDTLTGGTGADRFRYATPNDSRSIGDRILDFNEADGDIIDLSGLLDGSFTFIGAADFGTGPQVRAELHGSRTIVEATFEGTFTVLTISVMGTVPLTADAFLL